MPYYTKSKTTEWETPQAFFDRLDDEFHFTLDVCATKKNAKVENYFSKKEDALALARPWTCEHMPAVCWMNPPYGREIAQWIAKAAMSARHGATVVCLVPARTDTKWFHEICIPHGEVRFVKNRLYFGDGSERAPFPSMVVIFRPRLQVFASIRSMESK